jgi:hypothetical protein
MERSMARPARDSTPKTTDFHFIDLAVLRRKGAISIGYAGTLTWSRNGHETGSIGYRVEHGGMRLCYQYGPPEGGAQQITELIPFDVVQVRFGGARRWFRCPGCARRCRVLYGGKHFRCRLCSGLRYPSQYETAPFRVLRRLRKIHEVLAERGSDCGVLGLDDGLPPKPLRMHWTTYRRLEALDKKLAGQWFVGAGDKLQRR